MYPRADRPFILSTDAATDVGVGAVLKQLDDEGRERVIAYYGRRFNKAERNYTVTECELLAVVEAVKHFRPYLWGRHFKLITDHMALKWLHTMREAVSGGLSSRLTRWTLRLQEYDFEVEHKPGKDHHDADAVSRLVTGPADEDTSPTAAADPVTAALADTRTSVVAAVSLAALTGADPRRLQADATAAIVATLQSTPDTAATGASIASLPTAVQSAITCLRDTVHQAHLSSAIPDAEGLREAQLADPVCSSVLSALASGFVADSPHAQLTRRLLPHAAVENGLLYRQASINNRPHRLLWIPADLQHDVIRAFHDQAGHRTRHHTYEAMRRSVYWPGMHDAVADHVIRCHECAFAKRPNRHQGRHYRPDVGTYPFDCLVCDVLDMSSHRGPTSRGNTKLVVFADSLSRWVEAIPVAAEPDSAEVLDLFVHHIFSRYGLPRTVRSDVGSNLTSKLCKAVYEHAGIELEEATAHHHESAGLVERVNDTLCGMIRASSDEGKDWDEYLPYALFAYRSSPHRVTRESPAYLLYGHELRGPHHVGLLSGPLPAADPRTGDYLRRFALRMRMAWNTAYHFTKQQQKHDQNDLDRTADTSPTYEPNDRVLLRVPRDTHTHKLASQWEGPYRIAPDGVLPHGNYRLIDLHNRRRKDEVSGDRLRLYLTITDADRIAPDEFIVDRLLDRRGGRRDREYLVKWRGHPVREATWEPRASLLIRCSSMVHALDALHTSTTPADAVAPSPTAAPPAAPPAAAPPAAAPTTATPPVAASPAADATVPSAAKFERGEWLYLLTFPSRKGPVPRWYPSSRFSAAESDHLAALRAAATPRVGLPPHAPPRPSRTSSVPPVPPDPAR